jgi:hypothetical protein
MNSRIGLIANYLLKPVYSGFTIPCLIKIAALTKKIFGNNSKVFARFIGRIGILNNKSGNHSKAIPLLHLCIDISEDSGNTNKKIYRDCLINLGIAYSKIPDYAKAAKYLYSALDLERKRSGIYSKTYEKCLEDITRVYETYRFEKYEEDIPECDFSIVENELSKLYIDSCEISRRRYGITHRRFLENLLNLRMAGSTELVRPYYHEISEFLAKNDPFGSKKRFKVAWSHFNMFSEEERSDDNQRFKNKADLSLAKFDELLDRPRKESPEALNSVYGNMLGAMFDKPEISGIDETNKSKQGAGTEETILIDGLANNIEETLTKNQITCSLFSVEEATPGDEVFVQVFTHLPMRGFEATNLAKEFDRDASLRQFKSFDVEVNNEARLSFELEIKDIAIDDSVQHLTWRGVTDSVQFIIEIPDSYSKQSLIGKVRVALGNVPIGHLCFKISISSTTGQKKGNDQNNYFPMKNYRYAFISYASKDRAEVLRRVQMLDLLKVRYFQDILSLNPGDRWGNELLKQIDLADVFFLFWSSAARDSEWVLKEVEYALGKKKGVDENPPEIYPVLLEGPPFVEPPENLKHLHFNDKIVYFL